MDYIEGTFVLLEMRKEYKELKFVNEKIDKKMNPVQRLEVHNSIFEDMGFRETKIANCDFSHNTFVNCYFKNTEFWNVDFTGSRFIDCNFDGAKIQHSDFIYCKFCGCFIEYETMLNNLPNEYNLREKLCRNLSLESLNAGYDKDYKKYFYEMKKAGEIDNFETFRLNPKHYYKQKSISEKIIAFFEFCFSKFNKFIWGYGENIFRLFTMLIIIIVLFAFLFYSNFTILLYDNKIAEITILNAFFISIMNLCTTSAGFYAGNNFTEILFMIENVIGVLFLGLFVSVITKNINRR